MKSIKKILGLSLGLLLGMGAISCSEDVEYTPAEAVTGGQVFIAPSTATVNPSNYDLVQGKGTFDVTLLRGVKKGDLDVAIELSVEDAYSKIMSAPAVASFKDGDSITTVAISYDASELDFEEYVGAKLSIADDQNTTPYGVSEFEFTAAVPAPWTPWCSTLKQWVAAGQDASTFPMKDGTGTCTFTYAAYWSGDDPGLPISYRQSLLDPKQGQFMIEHWAMDLPLYIDYNTETNDCHVAKQKIGKQYSNGEDIVACDLETYNPKYTHDQFPCNYNPVTGQFQLYLYYHLSLGGWDALETVQVDGFYIPDYSLTAEIEGILTTTSQENYVVANVEFGSDVESVKAYIAQKSDDAAAVADALAAGDVEGYDVVMGTNKFPMGDLTGSLKLVIVAIAEGEAKAVAEAPFEYYGGQNPWKSIGTGLYTDDALITMFFQVSAPTYPVVIEENTNTPGFYRLVDPYTEGVYPYTSAQLQAPLAPAGSYLYIHAEDPEAVYVEEQSLGIDWGYGDMTLQSEGYAYLAYYGDDYFDLIKSKGLFGTLVDGVITFPAFEAQDSNGETYGYQWELGLGGKYYNAGTDIKVVLPSAVPAGVKAKAPAVKNFSAIRHLASYKKHQMNSGVDKTFVRAFKNVRY